MAYKRKTRDVWLIESLYNGGWNVETFSENQLTARIIAKEYRSNHPGMGVRVRKTRWPLGYPRNANKAVPPAQGDK